MSCNCMGCCFERLFQIIMVIAGVILTVCLAFSFVYVRSLVHSEAIPLDVPVVSQEGCAALLGRVIRISERIEKGNDGPDVELKVTFTPEETNALIVLLFRETKSLTPFMPVLAEPVLQKACEGFGEVWGIRYLDGEFKVTGLADIRFLPFADYVLGGAFVNMRLRVIPKIEDGRLMFTLTDAVVGNREMPAVFRGHLQQQVNDRLAERLGDPKIRRILNAVSLEIDSHRNLIIRYKPGILRAVTTGKIP